MNGESAQTNGGEAGSSDGGANRATLIVEPDQQAMQEARANAMQQGGNMTRQEQQEAMQAAQEQMQEIVAEAIADAEAALEDTDVTVQDTASQQGALLIEGPATQLIDLLDADAVGGLVSAASFDELGQQQQSG
jgi:adenylosuccinate synthase